MQTEFTLLHFHKSIARLWDIMECIMLVFISPERIHKARTTGWQSLRAMTAGEILARCLGRHWQSRDVERPEGVIVISVRLREPSGYLFPNENHFGLETFV